MGKVAAVTALAVGIVSRSHACAERVWYNAIHRVVPFAAYSVIRSDCRIGKRHKNVVVLKIKYGVNEISLSSENKNISVFVEVLVSIMCRLSVVESFFENQSE